MSNGRKIFGVSALFKSPNEILSAAKRVSEKGYTKWDVNTPYPVHGMDKAMNLRPSKLGIVTLFFGLSGTATALLLMWFTLSVDYPIVIGGKPFFALPAFIPITFELTVLLATVSTVVAMFAFFFALPSNDHALHDTEYMSKVSRDHFGVVIEANYPGFVQEEVQIFLQGMNPVSVDVIYEKEKVVYPIFEPKFITFLIAVAFVVSLGTYLALNKLLLIEPFSWMMNQAKLIPQSGTELFADGRSMRTPVEGTVARGFIPYPYMGIDEPPEYLSNPLLPTAENLKLGKKKFLTFCSPCHGNFGDGDSRLKGQFPNPPSLHSQRIRDFEDGNLYHTITNGKNIMPSYAAQIDREERWAIVNYIRALQKAKNVSGEELEIITKESGTDVAN